MYCNVYYDLSQSNEENGNFRKTGRDKCFSVFLIINHIGHHGKKSKKVKQTDWQYPKNPKGIQSSSLSYKFGSFERIRYVPLNTIEQIMIDYDI